MFLLLRAFLRYMIEWGYISRYVSSGVCAANIIEAPCSAQARIVGQIAQAVVTGVARLHDLGTLGRSELRHLAAQQAELIRESRAAELSETHKRHLYSSKVHVPALAEN